MSTLVGKGKEWAKANKCPICLKGNPCGCGRTKVRLIEDAIVEWVYSMSLDHPWSYKPNSEFSTRVDAQRLVNNIMKITEAK